MGGSTSAGNAGAATATAGGATGRAEGAGGGTGGAAGRAEGTGGGAGAAAETRGRTTVGGSGVDTGGSSIRGRYWRVGATLETGTLSAGFVEGLGDVFGATDRGGVIDVALRITALACTS